MTAILIITPVFTSYEGVPIRLGETRYRIPDDLLGAKLQNQQFYLPCRQQMTLFDARLYAELSFEFRVVDGDTPQSEGPPFMRGLSFELNSGGTDTSAPFTLDMLTRPRESTVEVDESIVDDDEAVREGIEEQRLLIKGVLDSYYRGYEPRGYT